MSLRSPMLTGAHTSPYAAWTIEYVWAINWTTAIKLNLGIFVTLASRKSENGKARRFIADLSIGTYASIRTITDWNQRNRGYICLPGKSPISWKRKTRAFRTWVKKKENIAVVIAESDVRHNWSFKSMLDRKLREVVSWIFAYRENRCLFY